MSEQTPEERRSLFRVVRGEPSDAELAALRPRVQELYDRVEKGRADMFAPHRSPSCPVSRTDENRTRTEKE